MKDGRWEHNGVPHTPTEVDPKGTDRRFLVGPTEDEQCVPGAAGSPAELTEDPARPVLTVRGRGQAAAPPCSVVLVWFWFGSDLVLQ